MINDEEFDFVSQMSHLQFGMVIIFGKIALWGPAHIWYVAGGVVVCAAAKEFLYDQREESSEVRGSNMRDWLYYVLGIAIALGAYYLLHWTQT